MPNTRPILKLAPEQWRRLLERIVSRDRNISPLRGTDPALGGMPQGMTSGVPAPSFSSNIMDPAMIPTPESTMNPALRDRMTGYTKFSASQPELPGAAPMVEPDPNDQIMGPIWKSFAPQREVSDLRQRMFNRLASETAGGQYNTRYVGELPIDVQKTRPGQSLLDDMMKMEPEKEVVLSRLRQRQGGGSFSEPTLIEKDMPYAEAKMKHLENPYSEDNPEGFEPVDVRNIGDLKRLKAVHPGSEEDVLGGEAGVGAQFEKIRYKKVMSQGEKQIAKIMKEEEPSATLPEILSTATVLDRMWQFMGGGRSTSGKTWEMLRSQSPGRNKAPNAKEYFIRCGLKWRENPERFLVQHKREFSILERMWQELEKVVGGADEAAATGKIPEEIVQ